VAILGSTSPEVLGTGRARRSTDVSAAAPLDIECPDIQTVAVAKPVPESMDAGRPEMDMSEVV